MRGMKRHENFTPRKSDLGENEDQDQTLSRHRRVVSKQKLFCLAPAEFLYLLISKQD